MGADKSAENAQNLSAQIVCPSPKVWNFDEKRLHWASVVRAQQENFAGVTCDIAIYLFCPYLTFKQS